MSSFIGHSEWEVMASGTPAVLQGLAGAVEKENNVFLTRDKDHSDGGGGGEAWAGDHG